MSFLSQNRTASEVTLRDLVTKLTGRATLPGLTTQTVRTTATTNAAIVKAAPGRVYGYHLSNPSAAWRYVRLFNQTALPVPGTTAAFVTVPVGPGASVVVSLDAPIEFTTGIGIAVTAAAGATDATVTAVNDVVGYVLFA